MKTKSVGRFLCHCARAAGFIGMVSTSAAFAAPPSDKAEALAHEQWSESIANTPVASEGCFMAEYPSTAWMPVGCTRAPDVRYMPRTAAGSQTVGNGHDYAASVTGLLSKTVGSFPAVSGVTFETDLGGTGTNDYSLQLNSNFMSTAACHAHAGCLTWQQFIYASGFDAVFMQYWLINYITGKQHCPSGWGTSGASCFKNSNAIKTAPLLPIGDLSGMKLSGSAVSGGKDSVVFTGAGIAYNVSQSDTVVDLATAWQQSEFNIVGDGNGSTATFNTGSHITVKLVTTGGGAPSCVANAGTTAETNNLNLGVCHAVGGANPRIQFVESN